MRTILKKLFSQSPALFVAGLALVVALGGVAAAAIPDSGGRIHACYSKYATDNGQPAPLFILDSDKIACPANYTALSWAQNQPAPPPATQVPGVSVHKDS